MSTPSIEKSYNPKHAASRKGSAKSNATARPKGWSAAADPKKFLEPNKTTTKKTTAKTHPAPRRKATASTAMIVRTPQHAVDTPPKVAEAQQPKLESATKQDRIVAVFGVDSEPFRGHLDYIAWALSQPIVTAIERDMGSRSSGRTAAALRRDPSPYDIANVRGPESRVSAKLA